MASSFINPKQILNEQLFLEGNMLAADFGCGSGEWAVSLAEILENGKVYAIDLLDEPLSAVRSKARIKKINNIEIVKSDIEKIIPRLLSQSLDLVLITNLLFQVKDIRPIFREAARVLKKGGQILVIDWDQAASIGPAQKIAPEELKAIAGETGFSMEKEFGAGDFHFGMVFLKTK